MPLLEKTTTPVSVNALGMLAEELHHYCNQIQEELAKERPDNQVIRLKLRKIATAAISVQAAL